MELPQIAKADRGFSLVFGRGQGGKKQRRKKRNDGDDDKEFDEREPAEREPSAWKSSSCVEYVILHVSIFMI